MSLLGKTPTQPGDTVRPKDAERILAGELLQELRHLRQTTTERAAYLASQVTNGVLEAGTWALDGDGRLTRSYHVAIGALVVTNNTGASITVTSSAPGPATPGAGDGVHLIPQGLVMTLPIASRAFTVYGTAGALVSVQVWTGLQPFGVAG